jgi:YD repeat-containing protein
LWSASVFSYDSMGRVNGMAECLPLWCGNSPLDKRLDFSYERTGNLNTSTDGAGVTTTYSYTPAGEIGQISSSLSDATHPGTLVSNLKNGPYGPISYQLGNGSEASLTYDIMGRAWGRWICSTSVQPYCAGGNQIYGSDAGILGAHISFSDDTAVTEHRDYSYDEFNRLKSTSIRQGQKTFSYSYDRYGNRWQQNAPQGGPAPSYGFNKSNNQMSGYGYDAAGNMTYDGFHNYIYNTEGNITNVDGGAGAVYVYNALNQRVQVDLPTVSHQYVYNAAGQRVSVWDTNTDAQVQGALLGQHTDCVLLQ